MIIIKALGWSWPELNHITKWLNWKKTDYRIYYNDSEEFYNNKCGASILLIYDGNKLIATNYNELLDYYEMENK